MAQYELITKILYVVSTLTLLGMNFAGIPASYMNLEADVNATHQDDYRKMAVMENVMSLNADAEEIFSATGSYYTYEQQRAVIPIEFFAENSEGRDNIGYKVNGDGHCYMEPVPGLDGEEYGFYIREMDPADRSDRVDNPKNLGCTEVKDSDDVVYAPALLIRKANGNPRIPVRIFIYSIGDGS